MATELATRNGADVDWAALGARFREPMPTKQRPGRGTQKFDYITARQVQDRLDEVVGVGAWSTAFRVLDPEGPAVECTLTVLGVSKVDCGYSNNPDSDHESEPLKAAYSDAFKRAAVHFGIGRFLYGDTVTALPATRPAAQQRAPMPQAAAVPPAKAQPDNDGRYYCAECATVLVSYEHDGRTILPQTLADQAFGRFGRVLCLDHARKAKEGAA